MRQTVLFDSFFLYFSIRFCFTRELQVKLQVNGTTFYSLVGFFLHSNERKKRKNSHFRTKGTTLMCRVGWCQFSLDKRFLLIFFPLPFIALRSSQPHSLTGFLAASNLGIQPYFVLLFLSFARISFSFISFIMLFI